MLFSTFTIFGSIIDVTVSVEDGEGLPGSINGLIAISMENQSDQVKGFQMDVCDAGDYLSCIGCETTTRTDDFTCSSNELANGCVRILLIDLLGRIIEKGDGPIFNLSYYISSDAPSG